MQKIITPFLAILATFLLMTINSFGQSMTTDSVPVQSNSKWKQFWNENPDKPFKNVIKGNLTNPMIFGENYNVIGYERVIFQHQTANIYIGRFSMPRFSPIDGDELDLYSGSNDNGFTLAIDYRFYLKSENKHNPPRGIYIGPYYSYINFERQNTWYITSNIYTGDLTTDINLKMNLVGAQLGYQFVIAKRFTLDMILMGPGIWFYNLKTTLNTSLSPEDETEILDKINEMLAEKYPGKEILLKPVDTEKKGSIKASSVGYRIMISAGFRF